MLVSQVFAGVSSPRAGRIAGQGEQVIDHLIEIEAVVESLLNQADEVGNRRGSLIKKELQHDVALGRLEQDPRQSVLPDFQLSDDRLRLELLLIPLEVELQQLIDLFPVFAFDCVINLLRNLKLAGNDSGSGGSLEEILQIGTPVDQPSRTLQRRLIVNIQFVPMLDQGGYEGSRLLVEADLQDRQCGLVGLVQKVANLIALLKVGLPSFR